MSQEQRNAAHVQIFEEPEKKTYKLVAENYRFFFNKAALIVAAVLLQDLWSRPMARTEIILTILSPEQEA